MDLSVPNLTAISRELKKSNDVARLKEIILECLTDVHHMEINVNSYGRLDYHASKWGEWVRAGDLQETAKVMAQVIAEEFLS